MNTKEAVAKRILDLCEERNMAINALASISGVSPSTIYSSFMGRGGATE